MAAGIAHKVPAELGIAAETPDAAIPSSFRRVSPPIGPGCGHCSISVAVVG